MKIKDGFVLHEVCGEKIILAEGVENINFCKIVSLNETAAFVWEKAQAGDFTEQSLTHALVAEYEVSDEQASKDVSSLLKQWSEMGMIEK